MKKCPYCAEHIQDEAVVCRFCGRDVVVGTPLIANGTPAPSLAGLDPYYRNEFQKIFESREEYKGKWNWTAFLFGAIWGLTKGLWLSVVICLVIALFTGGIGGIIYWFIYGARGNLLYYNQHVKGKQLAF